MQKEGCKEFRHHGMRQALMFPHLCWGPQRPQIHLHDNKCWRVGGGPWLCRLAWQGKLRQRVCMNQYRGTGLSSLWYLAQCTSAGDSCDFGGLNEGPMALLSTCDATVCQVLHTQDTGSGWAWQ